jgi:hypothetical protein
MAYILLLLYIQSRVGKPEKRISSLERYPYEGRDSLLGWKDFPSFGHFR